MLKTTQHSMWYSCQKNRWAAATNSINGESEGQCARKRGWVVYGWKESPQVLVGKVTDMFTCLGSQVSCTRAGNIPPLCWILCLLSVVFKNKQPTKKLTPTKKPTHQKKNPQQKTWFLKIAFFVYCSIHLVFNTVLSSINSLVLWAQVVL